MANNCLVIVCKECGGAHLLAKHFGDAYSCRTDTDLLDKFFEDHFQCEFEHDNRHTAHAPYLFVTEYDARLNEKDGRLVYSPANP